MPRTPRNRIAADKGGSPDARQAHASDSATFLIHPVLPFRLDLTVWALRRRPGNLIDQWDGETYRRVLIVDEMPFEITVAQNVNRSRAVRVTIHGKISDSRTKKAIRQAVENAFGMRVDLSSFYRFCARDSRLAPLVRRFEGLKPPRFFSVFDGLINGIACQQLSLSLGIQLLNRLAQNFGRPAPGGDPLAYTFPRPCDLAHCHPMELRRLGFNFRKARAIIEISQAIVEGKLNLEKCASLSDQEALQQLMELHGIGRWTAEYTLLRGMGRWHIFPEGDQGARNGLKRWLHLHGAFDTKREQRVLAAWEPFGGLIYFHMLMKGLDEAGHLALDP